MTESSRMPGQIALDHNHTAFLLPDFGTHRNYHVNEVTLVFHCLSQIAYNLIADLQFHYQYHYDYILLSISKDLCYNEMCPVSIDRY